MVVQLALFEAVTTLSYLVLHPNARGEATILFAYTYLRQIESFRDQPAVVAERQAILDRMPAPLVAEARRRMTQWPRNSSGKSIKDMATEGKVIGYDTFYRYASNEAHIGVVGEHVRVERVSDTEARLRTGREIPTLEMESMANFARRQLHGSFKIMWGVLEGPKIEFRSTNPDLWNPPSAR